ncbi:MAG: hypothetical protein CFH34_00251 [Alphaproteobacteria bacterium MarineAlpha9_Bin4]|nr:MAG: hypothetical protein CFH34_00251 [Alphaproteobacteria bacterium MarineAlpha9_Bin4]|tara:strand:- start:970 stop:2064 length:1095 start_codon:yes stop_codon:yes gene_type:complete
MKNTSKVVHVIADLGNGGAERQLIELLKYNPSHGLLILKNAGVYKKELQDYKINYLELNINNPLFIIFNLFKIRNAIKFFDALIIQCWMYNACFIITFIKLVTQIPHSIVWGIRCSDMNLSYYSTSLKLIFKLCRLLSFKANAIIYNSNAGLEYHKKLNFLSGFNKVIYNGIDYKKFKFSKYYRYKLRKNLGIKKNVTVIIFAARVDPMKNHISLLKAFETIRRKNKKTILLLIGKGTNKLNSQEGVIKLGMKMPIENYYSVGDIIILPSKFGEGFSNTLAEGMLCELFPATTEVGDSLEIISNIGVTFKNPTIKELTIGLQKTLSLKKNELLILKKKSRKRIIKKFNPKKMSDEYNNFYKELI